MREFIVKFKMKKSCLKNEKYTSKSAGSFMCLKLEEILLILILICINLKTFLLLIFSAFSKKKLKSFVHVSSEKIKLFSC